MNFGGSTTSVVTIEFPSAKILQSIKQSKARKEERHGIHN
jgi:hypothetical protein